MFQRLLVALLLAGLSIGPAFAWGQTGHRVSGAIADPYLSPEARAAITALLGPEDLAEASTYADFMRASDEAFWRAAGPFHYVTVPAGQSYAEVGAPDEGDAVTALAAFAAIITDPARPLEERQRALRFTIHIVADLHQPFHAGNGTDRGGNDVGVSWFGETTNLHAVWDSKMIDSEQLSFSEMASWLGRRITPEQAAAWQEPDPAVWIAESTALRDTLYPDYEDLRWDYGFQHRATVHLRLSQAGVRLAAYLNALFGEVSPETPASAG